MLAIFWIVLGLEAASSSRSIHYMDVSASLHPPIKVDPVGNGNAGSSGGSVKWFKPLGYVRLVGATSSGTIIRVNIYYENKYPTKDPVARLGNKCSYRTRLYKKNSKAVTCTRYSGEKLTPPTPTFTDDCNLASSKNVTVGQIYQVKLGDTTTYELTVKWACYTKFSRFCGLPSFTAYATANKIFDGRVSFFQLSHRPARGMKFPKLNIYPATAVPNTDKSSCVYSANLYVPERKTMIRHRTRFIDDCTLEQTNMMKKGHVYTAIADKRSRVGKKTHIYRTVYIFHVGAVQMTLKRAAKKRVLYGKVSAGKSFLRLSKCHRGAEKFPSCKIFLPAKNIQNNGNRCNYVANCGKAKQAATFTDDCKLNSNGDINREQFQVLVTKDQTSYTFELKNGCPVIATVISNAVYKKVTRHGKKYFQLSRKGKGRKRLPLCKIDQHASQHSMWCTHQVKCEVALKGRQTIEHKTTYTDGCTLSRNKRLSSTDPYVIKINGKPYKFIPG